MELDDLKSTGRANTIQMQEDTIMNINLQNALNTASNEELLRKRMENAPEGVNQDELSQLKGKDLGNGVHEFVPESIGIFNKPKEEVENDDVKALKIFDEVVLPAKIKEMQEVNEVIEAAGSITEDEILAMQGKSYITTVMEDLKRINNLKTYDMTDEEYRIKTEKENAYWAERDKERRESQKSYEQEFGLNVDNLDLPYAKEEIPYSVDAMETIPNPSMDDEEPLNMTENEVAEVMDNPVMTDKVSIKEVEEIRNDASEDTASVEVETTEDEEDFVLPEAQMVEDTVVGDTVVDTSDNEDEEDEELEEGMETKEQISERFKKSIRDKIKPVTVPFDISTYSLTTNAVAFSNSTQAQTTHFRSAKWALMSTGRPITMRSFKSTELDAMNAGNRTDSRYMAVKKQYQIIYNHILDEKPATVEGWAKVNSFLDLEHIWFSMYRACFEGSNYIPNDCSDSTKCRNVFLSEDVPIMDMVKFKDKSAKKRFFDILNKESNETSKMYVSEVVPISNDYAVALREPSIYNIVFETTLLDEKFLEANQDLVSILAYVDNIYKIDHVNHSLVPIKVPYIPENESKTYRARIKTYSKILDTLTSDQYRYVFTLVDHINNRGDDVTYIYPETNCPKCQKVVPETARSAQNMVFLRHQLVTFAI